MAREREPQPVTFFALDLANRKAMVPVGKLSGPDTRSTKGCMSSSGQKGPAFSTGACCSRLALTPWRREGSERQGWNASVIGFGAWAIGADWGVADDDTSRAALRAAAEAGVNFFDTADVYGDGRSERLVAELKKELGGSIFVATKAGRRGPAQRGPVLLAGEPHLLDGPQPGEPPDGDPRPRAAALPPDGPVLPSRGLRDS